MRPAPHGVLRVPGFHRLGGERSVRGADIEDELDELPVALVGVDVVVEVPEEPVLQDQLPRPGGVARDVGVGDVRLTGAEALEVLLEAASRVTRVARQIDRGLGPLAHEILRGRTREHRLAIVVEEWDLRLPEHRLDRHRPVRLAVAVAGPALVAHHHDRRVSVREALRGV